MSFDSAAIEVVPLIHKFLISLSLLSAESPSKPGSQEMTVGDVTASWRDICHLMESRIENVERCLLPEIWV